MAVVRRVKAQRAVSSHLNVCWTDVKLAPPAAKPRSKAEACQAAVDSIPDVKKAGTPCFVYVHSTEMIQHQAARGTSRPPEPTKQRKDSEDAWAELFHRSGDYSVFVPGRFFTLFQADVAGVMPEQDACFNSRAAPILLLTRKDGSVAAVFEGAARIKALAVVRAMCDILIKDGCVSNLAALGKISTLMASFEDAAMAAFEVEERVVELQAKVKQCESEDAGLARRTGKERKDSASTLAARKALEKIQSTLNLREGEKTEILKQEYALLQDMGMPASRMPKAPADTTLQ